MKLFPLAIAVSSFFPSKPVKPPSNTSRQNPQFSPHFRRQMRATSLCETLRSKTMTTPQRSFLPWWVCNNKKKESIFQRNVQRQSPVCRVFPPSPQTPSSRECVEVDTWTLLLSLQNELAHPSRECANKKRVTLPLVGKFFFWCEGVACAGSFRTCVCVCGARTHKRAVN